MSATDEYKLRDKIVRISASLPENERDELDKIVSECLKSNLPINKSELVRIGLKGLNLEKISESLDELRRLKHEKKKIQPVDFRWITNSEWKILETLIPPSELKTTNKSSGRPPKHDDRDVLDGVIYRLITESTFREIPGNISISTLNRMQKRLENSDKLNEILNFFIDCAKNFKYDEKIEVIKLIYKNRTLNIEN